MCSNIKGYIIKKKFAIKLGGVALTKYTLIVYEMTKMTLQDERYGKTII